MRDDDFEYIGEGSDDAGKKKSVKKRGRKRRRSDPASILVPVLIVTLLITVGLSAVLYLQLRAERAERTQAEQTLVQTEQVLATDYMDQATVNRLVTEARESGREEGVRQFRDELRASVEAPEARVFDVLRRMYPEYVLFSGPNDEHNGNHFIPIDPEMPENTVQNAGLSVSENGVIRYFADGEEKAEMMLDVSQYQGEIDWEQVAEYGIRKVIIRAGFRGYGSGKLVADEQFEANMDGALENGIEVGVYFVTQAISAEEAHEEFAFLTELLEPYKDRVTLPVVLDVERIAGDDARTDFLKSEERTDLAIVFLEDVRAAGYQPMVYANIQGLFGMMNVERLREYPVWYAYYDTYIYYPYRIRCWQYAESGVIPGIDGKVDLNLWFED